MRRESDKIMIEEIKYMKKGGAPKSLIEHEKREHKEMKREAKKETRKK